MHERPGLSHNTKSKLIDEYTCDRKKVPVQEIWLSGMYKEIKGLLQLSG